ncbi:hypothetical protein H8959_020954 [Pygathrix nigripes]
MAATVPTSETSDTTDGISSTKCKYYSCKCPCILFMESTFSAADNDQIFHIESSLNVRREGCHRLVEKQYIWQFCCAVVKNTELGDRPRFRSYFYYQLCDVAKMTKPHDTYLLMTRG